MELSEAGIEAARMARGNTSAPRSASSQTPSTEGIVRAYLEAAGFTEEAETKAAGRGAARKDTPTGRVRLVSPWTDPSA